MPSGQRRSRRLNGAFDNPEGQCAVPGCSEPGEFRAPSIPGGDGRSDGPGHWQYLCLEHVRAFNAGYDFFAGMSSDEIYEAQHPIHGFDSRRRVYDAGGGGPAWADFTDPLDAIAARFRAGVSTARTQAAQSRLSRADRDALHALELDEAADRKTIRRRYSELVRRYHPDRNGGDRTHENRLAKVIDAYTHLKKSPAFE